MQTTPSHTIHKLTLYRANTRKRHRDDGSPRTLGSFYLRLNGVVLAECSHQGYAGILYSAQLVLKALEVAGLPVVHHFEFKTYRESNSYCENPLESLAGPDGDMLRAMGWELPLQRIAGVYSGAIRLSELENIDTFE